MRFLADENLERRLIDRLVAEGHDVAVAADTHPSATDPEVLARAAREQRILLTNDKDFAELAFLRREISAGILLLRLHRMSTAQKAERLMEVVAALGDRRSRGSFRPTSPRQILSASRPRNDRSTCRL